MGTMATYTPKTATADEVHFYGWFRPNGTDAIIDGETPGVTAARTDVGTSTLTLRDAYTAITFVGHELGQATPGDQYTRLGSVTTSVATLVVWDVSDAAAADVAADANSKIFYHIVGRAVTTT